MRKNIAAILAFILTFQFTTSTFASDPVAETKQLQACVEKKYDQILEQFLDTGHIVEITSDSRLDFAKYMLVGFLFAYENELHKAQKSLDTTKGIVLLGAITALGMQITQSRLSKNLSSLKNFYEKTKLSAPDLAKAGGEELLTLQMNSLERVAKITRNFKWAFIGLTVLMGYLAYLGYQALEDSATALSNASGNIDDLMHSQSEIEFYQSMSSSDDVVGKLRKFSIGYCNALTEDVIKSMIQEMDKAEPEKVDETIKFVQTQIKKESVTSPKS